MPRVTKKRPAPNRPAAHWRPTANPAKPGPADPPLPAPSLPAGFDPDSTTAVGPDPRPLVDRRQLPRVTFAARAALAPADDTGAVRPPAIRTRDLNPLGLGFIARQDLSVLGEAVLHLPGPGGRVVSVRCRVRRSRELGNGWYDGLAEFVVPQPLLTVDGGQARLPRSAPRKR